MSGIRRLVLDILKPHKPSIVDFAEESGEIDGVKGVNVILIENDSEVQNVKITLEGKSVIYDDVKQRVEDLGGSIHSVDEIVYGNKMVEESETPQD